MSDTHRERLLRITFSRSGGFAPVFKPCELDPENLSGGRCRGVALPVRAEWHHGHGRPARCRGRDVRQYDLCVQTDRRTHEVGFDQLSVPTSARPLLEFLQQRSLDLLPGDSTPLGAVTDSFIVARDRSPGYCCRKMSRLSQVLTPAPWTRASSDCTCTSNPGSFGLNPNRPAR
jgi:hypothetical protein